MTHDYNHLRPKLVQCAICHADIKSLKGTYQSPEFRSIVCKDCVGQFPADDIDMMISLFYVYGGYYGQEKNSPFSVEDLLPVIISNMQQKEKNIEDFIDEFSKKSFHQALLHGITPREYIKSLRSLLD